MDTSIADTLTIYKGIPVSEVPKLEGDEVALVRLNLGIAWGKLGTALALYSSSPFSSVQKSPGLFSFTRRVGKNSLPLVRQYSLTICLKENVRCVDMHDVSCSFTVFMTKGPCLFFYKKNSV